VAQPPTRPFHLHCFALPKLYLAFTGGAAHGFELTLRENNLHLLVVLVDARHDQVVNDPRLEGTPHKLVQLVDNGAVVPLTASQTRRNTRDSLSTGGRLTRATSSAVRHTRALPCASSAEGGPLLPSEPPPPGGGSDWAGTPACHTCT